MPREKLRTIWWSAQYLPSLYGKVVPWMHHQTPGAQQYKNHRFPVEIISHAVWVYFCFCLSYRDVEELLFERGVNVTYEAIRKWSRKFWQPYANQLRRRRPRPGDKWHMDKVFLTINRERHYLSLASCGSRRECPRYFSAMLPGHAGCKEVLP